MKNTHKTALGGIVVAVGTVFMLLSSAIPFFEYAVPAAAGLLIVLMQAEAGKLWAAVVYAATSLLGVLIVPNKEAVGMYIALFGCYPLLKSFFDKLPKWLGYLLKSVFFVADILAVYYVLMHVFGISAELMDELNKVTLPLLIVLGLAAFLLYDRSMLLIERKYMLKYHKHVVKLFRKR